MTNVREAERDPQASLSAGHFDGGGARKSTRI